MNIKNILLKCFTWAVYGFSILQLTRYYVTSTNEYLDMPRYLAGQERLPFQERILPIALMWPVNHSAFMIHHFTHYSKGALKAPSASTPEMLAFYILSLVSFTVACYLVVRLYRALTNTGALSVLVLPVFMALTLWTYAIHLENNVHYPYDMPALAFFTGGLLAVYKRNYPALLAIMFFGTMNRETTLFLIGIYILDAASRSGAEILAREQNGRLSLRERFSFAQVSWIRAALLALVWGVVKLALVHRFAHNDNSENLVRIGANLQLIRQVRLWPSLFNICGYVLPFVLILRRQLFPLRFANYIYILPLWFAVMFYTGLLVETRIYGELCSFTAVATVLLLEEHIEHRQYASRLEASSPA